MAEFSEMTIATMNLKIAMDNMKELSKQAGESLAKNEYSQVKRIYNIGKNMIRIVDRNTKGCRKEAICRGEDYIIDLNNKINEYWTNLQGIYEVAKNPNSIDSFEVEKQNPDDDSKLEDMLGEQ